MAPKEILELRRAFEQDPSDGAKAWYYLQAVLESAAPEDALQEASRVKRVLPNNGDICMCYGEALLRADRPGDALAALDRISRGPGPRLPYDVGMCHLRIGDYASSRKELESALRADRAYSNAWAALMDIAVRLGDFTEAEAIRERAAGAGCDETVLLCLDYQVDLGKGRLEEALEIIRRMVSIAPSHRPTRIAFEDLLFRMGRVDEFYASVAAAFVANPIDKVAAYRLAKELKRRNRPIRAWLVGIRYALSSSRALDVRVKAKGTAKQDAVR